MTPITVVTEPVADARIHAVNLQRVVGAYELVFIVYVSARAGEEHGPHASIVGARVAAASGDDVPQPLGFARPEEPFDIVPVDFPRAGTRALHLPLQPGQVAALETLREARDLTFQLTLVGTGKDDQGSYGVHANLGHFPVARSDWLRMLGAAGARNVILIEVPLPIHASPTGLSAEIASSLQRAEAQYRDSDYTACVGPAGSRPRRSARLSALSGTLPWTTSTKAASQ